MTLCKSTEIECPECGENVETEIWDSLNVSMNPETKNDFLEGKINLFKCSNCDLEASIPKSFAYHDMDKQFYAVCLPFEQVDNGDFFDQFLPNGKLNFESHLEQLPENTLSHYMRDNHIVFSMEELIRYVIFRDKLSKATE